MLPRCTQLRFSRNTHIDWTKRWQYICGHNYEKCWWILIIFTYLETGMNTCCKHAVYLFFISNVNMTSQLGNWRGISLMSLLAKLYNCVLLNRLRLALDPLLRKNQNGFRPGRGCPEHILCLRRLIEGFKVKGGGGVIIDFRKRLTACVGSVECIPPLLAAYGVPPPMIHQLRERRLTFAGHCYRCEDHPVKHLVLWEGRAGRMLRTSQPPDVCQAAAARFVLWDGWRTSTDD